MIMSELTYGIDSGHLNFPKDKLWRQLQEHLETELNNASDIPQSLIDNPSSSDQENDRQKKGRVRRQGGQAIDRGAITTVNREYWFRLIKLYEIVGNIDALHGIWSRLAEEDGVLFRPLVGQD